MGLWDKWSKQADADGQLNIYGLQELAAREMVESGEVLIRKRLRRPEDGLAVPLQLQIMESDQLDGSKVSMNGNNRIINGVEVNIIGRRTAYWMFEDHPGSLLPGAGLLATLQSKPVPADQIIHFYRKERTQMRGTPWGSAVIRSLCDLDN